MPNGTLQRGGWEQHDRRLQPLPRRVAQPCDGGKQRECVFAVQARDRGQRHRLGGVQKLRTGAVPECQWRDGVQGLHRRLLLHGGGIFASAVPRWHHQAGEWSDDERRRLHRVWYWYFLPGRQCGNDRLRRGHVQ